MIMLILTYFSLVSMAFVQNRAAFLWVCFHLMIKLNIEYGAIASKAAQPHSNSKAAAQNQAQKASAPSNALALPGIAVPG